VAVDPETRVRSNITQSRDVDMAEEMVNFTKMQILPLDGR
jgi:flagellin-like hook-associated protein FlgL